MDLKRKLNFYKSRQTKAGEARDGVEIPPALRALRDHFSAEILFSPLPVLKISQRISIPKADKTSIDLNLLSRGQIPKNVEPGACLFFDLETTGLSGGTGTYAFLIGFAYLKGESIVCEQYFLPDYGREPELFKHLTQWFRQFDYFVSYNGKSYDMPLLRNRFRLNRQDTTFSETRHIDLVHYCRRIWRDSLPDCRLGTIELLLLENIERSGDIPGALIPQAYFDYLSTGRIHDIIRIIEHNRQDLISMPQILGRLALLNGPINELPLDAPAIEALARLAAQAADPSFLETLEKLMGEKSLSPEPVWYYQAITLKKAGEWLAAAALWERLVDHPRYFCEAARELAMYNEHRKKDFITALKYVEKVLRYLEIQTSIGEKKMFDRWYEDFQKRCLRLKYKVRQK